MNSLPKPLPSVLQQQAALVQQEAALVQQQAALLQLVEYPRGWRLVETSLLASQFA